MNLRGDRERGFGLVYVLALATILLILGLTMLTNAISERRRLEQTFHTNQARLVARTALDYFTYKSLESSTFFTAGRTVGPYQVGNNGFFTLTPDGHEGCRVDAWVEAPPGRKVASITLIKPGNLFVGGDWTTVYDPNL